jgi:hypothetical protein
MSKPECIFELDSHGIATTKLILGDSSSFKRESGIILKLGIIHLEITHEKNMKLKTYIILFGLFHHLP